jgi:hypothetical protein
MKILNNRYKERKGRQDEMKQMLSSGMSLDAIGKKYGLSRQRVHQILNDVLKEHKEVDELPEVSKEIPDMKLVMGLKQNRRIKELARIRDNHTCQFCKRQWDGNGNKFDVHNFTSKSYKFKDIPNMITVCHECLMNFLFTFKP